MKDANAPRSELSSKRTSQVTVGPPRWSTFSSKNGEDDKDDDASCCFDGDRLPLAEIVFVRGVLALVIMAVFSRGISSMLELPWRRPSTLPKYLCHATTHTHLPYPLLL